MPLHYNTVQPELLDLIKRVSADPFFSEYRLVGGTSLSLQIGHRSSIDADFFAGGKGQPVPQLIKHVFPSIIKTMAKVEPDHGCMGSTDSGIKLDLFDYGDPFVKEPVVVDGIRLANMVDIGLMKLDVQNRRNAWKDLIDLDSITDFHPLSELFSNYNIRYPALPLKQAVMSLIQNLDTPPPLSTFPAELMLQPTNPKDVVLRLKVKWANFFDQISKSETMQVKAKNMISPNKHQTGSDISNRSKPKNSQGY